MNVLYAIKVKLGAVAKVRVASVCIRGTSAVGPVENHNLPPRDVEDR